ncbi:MAG: sigma-70 family RNA polymerase sigma factor [Myxococcales bacterium]|nr:sigma-70 family RNA polymerase sigma factor [Myxococcales bacterium]
MNGCPATQSPDLRRPRVGAVLSSDVTETEARRAVEVAWRMHAPALIARLTRMLGDVGVAEDVVQDVLMTAIERWPRDGVPDEPGAWLMTAAKRRGIDHLRTQRVRAGKREQLVAERSVDEGSEPDLDDPISDELLRLVFIACHPVLPREGRVALTLKLLGGLSTAEIARAFLQTEPTIAQRIVRAKRALAAASVPFELPPKPELAERLASVLEVVYLIFNEGYSATSGESWMRTSLVEEALRLGRVLAGLMPDEPDVYALLGLMELTAARSGARATVNGEPVLLERQDRARWDPLQIRRGLAALDRALDLGGAQSPLALQAAIAACHARAARFEDTDWARIAALYGLLAIVAPSPVVELNRAVALSRAAGPEAGLAVVEVIDREGTLAHYPYLEAVRGDLLEQLDRLDDAAAAFERAADLTRNEPERAEMRRRAERITGRGRPS